MNRTLTRQQRRHIDRQLRKLLRSNVCSICGGPFKHNSRTRGGLDSQGGVVLAGECCSTKVAATFVRGVYSARQHDFPWPHGDEPNVKPTDAQITEAIRLYQNFLTEADRVVDDLIRRGGDVPVAPKLNLLDQPWKANDRDWFERNPKRSHRVRIPFPGELVEEAAKVPTGKARLMLVRQLEPGSRLRPNLCLDADLLPLPDDEAVAHALFEVAIGREAMPVDRQAFCVLIEKYAHRSHASDA
jgi:hypothetical protein